MRIEIGILTPDRIDCEAQMTICDMWSGAKNLTNKRQTDPELIVLFTVKMAQSL